SPTGGFPGPGGALDRGVGAALGPPPGQVVERLQSAGDALRPELGMVLGRHQPWENHEAARANHEIMETAAVLTAPHLDHAHSAPVLAVNRGNVLHRDDTISQALELRITLLRGAVIEQEDDGLLSDEILLEREQLPAVAQGALREQSDLRQ